VIYDQGVAFMAWVLAGGLLAPGAVVEPSFTGSYRTKGHSLRLLQCGRRIVGAITGFSEDSVRAEHGEALRAHALDARALGRIL